MISESDLLPDLAAVTEMHMSRAIYDSVIEHARRKVEARHLPGETPERKAFGLLAGRAAGGRAEITHAIPIPRNVRAQPPYKDDIDELVFELAVPSETPPEGRGWMIHPTDLLEAQRTCDDAGVVVIGSYHTHRVGWDTDPVRDSCTALDRELASGTSLWMFILSVVDLDRPILRAYFEGDNGQEAEIVVHGDRTANPDDGESR